MSPWRTGKTESCIPCPLALRCAVTQQDCCLTLLWESFRNMHSDTREWKRGDVIGGHEAKITPRSLLGSVSIFISSSKTTRWGGQASEILQKFMWQSGGFKGNDPLFQLFFQFILFQIASEVMLGKWQHKDFFK